MEQYKYMEKEYKYIILSGKVGDVMKGLIEEEHYTDKMIKKAKTKLDRIRWKIAKVRIANAFKGLANLELGDFNIK